MNFHEAPSEFPQAFHLHMKLTEVIVLYYGGTQNKTSLFSSYNKYYDV